MIGERIRQARIAAGLSLDRVVAALAERGVSLSKMSLSKYEREAASPRANVLQALSQVLDVEPSFFLRELEAKVDWLAYRRKSQLGEQARERIQLVAERSVERFLWLRQALRIGRPKFVLQRIPVSSFEGAEDAAEEVRRELGLGVLPVDRLIAALEKRDVLVVAVSEAKEPFCGLAGVANEEYAVLVYRKEMNRERTRFTVAHELGHIAMDTGAVADPTLEEKFAHRFAAALLVPREAAFRELGHKRRSLSLPELVALSRQYGLSVHAWLYRARDLEIIEEGHFKTMFVRLSAAGMRKQSFGDEGEAESPTEFAALLRRAVAEGVVERQRAIKWAPELSEELGVLLAAERGREGLRPTDYMRMPPERRRMILREAAERAADLYAQNGSLFVEDIVDDGDHDA